MYESIEQLGAPDNSGNIARNAIHSGAQLASVVLLLVGVHFAANHQEVMASGFAMSAILLHSSMLATLTYLLERKVMAAFVVLAGVLLLLAFALFLVFNSYTPSCCAEVLLFLAVVGADIVLCRCFVRFSSRVSWRWRFKTTSMLGMAVCFAGSFAVIVHMILIRYLPDGLGGASASLLPSVLALTLLATSMLVYGWLHACCIAIPNDRFFARVRKREAKESDRSPDFDNINNVEILRQQFFLSQLVLPSTYTRRISEWVNSHVGTYEIKTEYHIDIVKSLMGRKIYLPLVLRSKRELSQKLTMSSAGGEMLTRLSDQEVEDLLYESLKNVFCLRFREPDKAEEIAREIARMLMSDDGIDAACRSYDACRDKLIKAVSNQMGEDDIVEFLEELFFTMRVVKPVCVSLTPREQVECLVLTVEQEGSLVPLRMNYGSQLGRLVRRVFRLFTKRRTSYYFNLANADRARSYHLFFSGPKGTYLTDARLRMIDTPQGNSSPYVCAESMTVMNRHGQEKSRLYVKNGYAFRNASLYFACRDRNRRAVQSVWVLAMISAVLLLFGYASIVNTSNGDLSFANLAPLFFAVMTVAGVASVWEVLNSQHAEEWLWVACITTIVAVLLFFSLVLVGQGAWAPEGDVGQRIVLKTLIGVLYLILLPLGVILFKGVKLHGIFVGRVPMTKSLRDEGNEFIDFDKVERQYNKEIQRTGRVSGYGIDAEKPMTRRRKRYKRDIIFYNGLFGNSWSDGWVIPVWTALCDPYRSAGRTLP